MHARQVDRDARDRLAPPATLTPSKIDRFIACPLAFRYAYIDHLPEPPSIHQVRGTLVHGALQRLHFDTPAGRRSHQAARVALEHAWAQLGSQDEVASLDLDAKGRDQLLSEARELLEHYFELEDPDAVCPIGIELDLRVELSGIELRGIIDRLDRREEGDLVVVDYKTGRAPRPEQSRSRLGGVAFYAFLCEQVLGRRPSEVRLIYLRDRVVIAQSPSDQTMRGLRQRAIAVWQAIERACERDDFRPSPSPLCKTCAFQPRCPAISPRAEHRIDHNRASVAG